MSEFQICNECTWKIDKKKKDKNLICIRLGPSVRYKNYNIFDCKFNNLVNKILKQKICFNKCIHFSTAMPINECFVSSVLESETPKFDKILFFFSVKKKTYSFLTERYYFPLL